MIADYKKTPRRRWAGAMLLLAVFACVILTNAYVVKGDYIFGTATEVGPPVNTTNNEGSPSISADGLTLYFSSDSPDGYGSNDLMVATRKTLQDIWEAPMNLGEGVNTSSFDGMPSISSDGLSLYFTSTRLNGVNWDIYVTSRQTLDDPWEEPVNIGSHVNSSSGEYFPNISSDGLSLFFASDRPGSGFIDLYVAKRETVDDDWTIPVNLGSPVNTSVFEGWPSISSDGLSLFFCSFRSGGYGSGELWVSTRATIDESWGEPVNLGPSVNAASDDACPSISADGSTLYFFSDRSGGVGGNDLWQVKILPVVDFNGDGNIDTDDLLILIGYWGQDEPLCDIGPMPYGDGIVDIKDLEVFMSYWEKENMPETPEEEQ